MMNTSLELGGLPYLFLEMCPIKVGLGSRTDHASLCTVLCRISMPEYSKVRRNIRHSCRDGRHSFALRSSDLLSPQLDAADGGRNWPNYTFKGVVD